MTLTSRSCPLLVSAALGMLLADSAFAQVPTPAAEPPKA